MPAASMKPKGNTNGMPAVNNDTKSNPVKDDTSNKDEYLDPKSISQGIIDKKIRNLVKRRDKLMDFKNKEERGVKLEKEQKDALSKLDYVVETIEMLKDISKNVTESLNDFQKKQNKAQKKEAIAEKAKQKAEDSSRLHVMYQLPFIARFFDKIRPALEQDGKLESNYIEAFSQFSALFNKFENESVAVLERFFAGDSAVYAENISYAVLKDGLFQLVESNFFKSFFEPEIGYLSFEQEQTSLNGNPEPEVTPIVPPVVPPVAMDMHDVVNIENDMQSKDPAVLAVGHGFTFQGLPPHPVNGVAFMTQVPVFPHPTHVPTENFHMMNPPVPMESHIPPTTSEDEKNLPVTDESKSDGASTPDGQVGNFSNRRGNFRGRGRYFRGNRNQRPKIGFFNPKGSNEDMNQSPEGPKDENREGKKRYNKPRSARNEENGHSQNDQSKPSPPQEQKPNQRSEQAKNSVSPQSEQKAKPQNDVESGDNAIPKKNFNGGDKRNNWAKRSFNNNGNNHPAENGDSLHYDKQHDGQRPYYNRNNGYNRNGFRGGRGGFRNNNNNNNFGNRPYQQQQQQQGEQRA